VVRKNRAGQLNVYSGIKSGVNINNRVLRAELTNLNWNAANLYNAVVTGNTAAFDAIFYGQDSFVYSGDIGADSFTGSIFADKIDGEQGNDVLFGDNGDDVIFGGTGNDTLVGGDGNDILNGGTGADKIAGGLDTDTADYSGSALAVTIDLTKQGTFDPVKNVITKATAQTGGDAQGDLLSSIENVIGSDSNDIFIANLDANEFDGGKGKDTVSYAASTGKVTANLASGEGKGGFAEGDKYTAIENLIGSKFDDVLTGDGNDNTLDGGLGDDILAGRGGADQLIGGANGAGGDTADYSASGDKVTVNLLQQATGLDAKTGLLVGGTAQTGGHADGDKLFGIENVIGSAFDDVITGNASVNIIEGGAGEDILTGVGAGDIVSYASSSKAVYIDLDKQDGAAKQSDKYWNGIDPNGDAAGDVLKGFVGIIGSDHDDFLFGVQNDAKAGGTFYGGKGNDYIQPGKGKDTVFGGDGDDEAFLGLGGGDTFDGGNGEDWATFNSGSETAGITITLGKDGTLSGFSASGGAATGLKLVNVENVGGTTKNDRIIGNNLANELDGGAAGDDYLDGGAGDDILTGDAGNDMLIGGAGADKLDGGDGIDTASYALSKAGVSVNLTTGEGNGGDAEGDTLIDIENLIGSAGNDIFIGSAGANMLNGGAGDDILAGHGGADHLIGGLNGAGGDTADYSGSKGAVTVNLLQQATGIDAKTGLLVGGMAQKGGHAEDDKLFGIENVIGSTSADTITGDAKNNVIEGRGGADTLDGGLGIDTVSYAGSGAGVTVDLGTQDGVIEQKGGDAEGDTLKNFENITGSSKDDVLIGNALANILTGGAGDDKLSGMAGIDTLIGGDGDDVLNGGAGADKIVGGDGVDSADYSGSNAAVTIDLTKQGIFDAVKNVITKATAQKGGDATGDLLSGIENVIGSAFNDLFIANGVANKFEGGAGTDTVSYAASAAGVHASLLGGGFSNDATGDEYVDIENLVGSNFNDQLFGDSKANKLEGLGGNDTLDGGAGGNILDGGAGNDQLRSGKDADQLIGGTHVASGDGAGDTASYGNSDAAVTVNLSQQGTGFNATTGKITGPATFKTQTGGYAEGDALFGIENISGSNFDDVLTGDANANVLWGNDGNDTLSGLGGNDHLLGRDGDDILDGGAGADILEGGDGIDTVTYANSTAAVTIGLGSGGNFGVTGVGGDAAGDKIKNVENLIGSNFNDKLTGNEDDNVITGGKGNDILTGGAGADTFVYNAGNGLDTITDFKNGVDLIDISSMDGIQFGDLDIQQSGANTLITFNATNKITLLNFAKNDLDASDFKFGNAPVPTPQDDDPDGNAVDENATNGTLVGITAKSVDPDDGETVTYSLTDNANGAFEIDANTGVVTVADGSKIDREQDASLNITVKATSTDGTHASKTFTIAINDVDEFDATTPSDSNVAANSVNENAANGTLVGITAFSEDEDATTSTITYELTDSANGAFQIDANTGIVTVADGSKIDRESDASLDITVKATSSDGSSASKTFTINISDADEFAPEITSNGGGASAAVSIDENTKAVTTVMATDGDATASIVYSISGGLDAALFTIDADTGELTFKSAPDFEDPADADFDNVYEVEVTATSGAKSDTQTIKVTVDNAEEAPVFTSGNFTIGENTTEIGTVTAFDPDGTGTLVYSIDGGDDAATFEIDANTGVLSFVKGRDFETPGDLDNDNVYEVTIKASDGTSSKTQNLTVTVTDINEAPTKIALDNAAVDEMSAIGTVVGTLATTDPDADDASQNVFTYKLVDDADGRFALDGNKIVVAGDIDYETNLDGISIQVQAKDSAGNVFGQTLNITVNDLEEVTAPDGYIAGATIFADKDGDFELDAGEASVTSDAFGNFNFTSATNPIVLTGGADIATGKAFTGYMSAHAQATVVSPLTTLVHHLHLQFDGDYNESTANSAVLSALGLNAGIGNLKNYDQIAAAIAGDPNAPDAAKAATRLQEFLAMGIAVLTAAGASAKDAQYELLRQVNTDIWASTPLAFGAAQVEGYINGAATALSVTVSAADATDAGQIIAAILAAMDALASTGTTLLEELAEIAIVASNAAADIFSNFGDIGSIESIYTANLAATISAESGNAKNVAGINGDNTLNGTDGADFLDGGAGNDTLNGGKGNDVLVGGEGNDTLNGGGGKDVLVGGAGDDVIDGGQWYTAYSNEGSGDLDRVSYADALSAVTVDLSIKGTPQNTGGGGTDSIVHVEGIIGSAFDDVLSGGGNDYIETFRGGAGDDYIDGNGGYDRAEYVDAIGSVTIDLGAGTVDGTAAGLGTDTLRGIEEIFGGNFDDIFDASGFTVKTADTPSVNAGDTANVNSFHGGGGDDVIIGNGQTRIDYILATHGVTVDLTNRDVDANTGRVYGGDGVGTDTFSGVNRIRGSMFDDVLLGGQQEYGAAGAAEFFNGMAGDDFIFGGSGFDYAQYGIAAFFLDGVVASAANTAQSDYWGQTFGIIVNMADGTVYGDARSFGTDTLREVEGVVGSVRADLYDATGFGLSSDNKISQGLLINEFEGGAGDDIIIGNGNTRVSYRNATAGVTVDLSVNNDGSGTVKGDDSVGTDTLVGGISSIRGSDFADTLIGYNNTTGIQIFDGQGGKDYIDGGGGFDRATYNQDAGVSKGITVTLTATGTFGSGGTLTGAVTGNTAEVGDDELHNIESVTGTDFADVLKVVNGGSAANFGVIEFEGAGGNDTITGLLASGTFTRASYITATDSVTVTFNNSGTGTANTGTAVGNSSVGTDTLTNIRDVRGGNYDDVINGRTSGVTAGGIDNNAFQGGAGGNDLIEGGLGNDIIWGGDADNTNGTERMDGVSAAGFDDFDWASYVNASAGVTVNLYAGTGSITWNGGLATGQTGDYGTATTSTGNTGADTLVNIEGVRGSAFDDVLNGGNYFFEIFRGNGGNDTINGGGGTDVSDYRNAGSAITVDLAAGTVTGGAGSDTLTGVEGIYGSAHADKYDATGFSGSSTNAGSLGTFNFFRGGAGDDIIIGNGNTRIDYADGSAGITVDLGAASVDASAAGLGIDDISGGGINQVRGTAYADHFIGTTTGDGLFEAFIGGGGDDKIDGGGGFDRAQYHLDGNISTGLNVQLALGIVTGDADLTGTDTLISVEAITGSILADVYDARGFGPGSTNAGSNGTFNEFEGHAGNDVIHGNGNTRIAFYNAQEGVTVDLANGVVNGGYSVGTDTIMGGVNAARGSNFADTIIGNGGANVLEGQAGDDRLIGLGGNDKLTGGAGNDTFVFNTANFGADVITDFGVSGDDAIEFGTSIFADYAAVQAAMTQVGADVLITSSEGSILIKNMTVGGLSAGDFAFV
jgi:Ca2+-binding RTX toxin-like protein